MLKDNKKRKIIIISIITIILFSIGISYAIYAKFVVGTNNNKVIAGDIYMRYINGESKNITIHPSDTYIPTDYFEFIVEGKNTSNKTIIYDIVLNHGEDQASPKIRLQDKFLRFRLVTVSNNVETEIFNNRSYSTINNTRIFAPTIPANTNSYSVTYRLYVWVNGMIVGNVNQDYTESEWANVYANLSVSVTGDFSEKEVYRTSSEKVLAAADVKETATPACANKTRDTSDNDGITYISGTSDCIDFNYVWYSGKLWRITAIYPDGTMKMITDNNITSIAFNESTPYYYTDANNTSYMYQWLNEDFLDTLYNYENIIVHDSNTYWNATMPDSETVGTKPAETTMIPTSVSPVGLLNSYEYYKAYQNATTTSTNYLNIGYYWWLLEPYYDATTPSKVRYVDNSGPAGYAGPAYCQGIRPSVILQSGVTFTGSGSKTDPYKIVGDMSSPILGTTKVNERVFERNNNTYSYNGEYVKIKYNNELSPLYRIVGVETDPSDNTKTITKLVAMDYADNKATKQFATANTDGSGTIYGSGDTIDTTNSPPTTWYSYLNGTGNNDGWIDNLSYNSLLTSGTYYMGNGNSSNYYKEAICSSPSASVLTRNCTKTANTDTFNVGLLRYGEMFATQQKTSTNTTSIIMWLITKYSSSSVRTVHNTGRAGSVSPANTNGARSTIHLISNAKFLTCSTSKCDGTEAYPYEVGL